MIFISFLIKIGGGRKVKEPKMVDKLLNWYYSYHCIGKNKITTKEFKQKALEFSEIPDFCASKGWLQKFRKKYQIELN